MSKRVIRGIAPAIACAALLLSGCSQESADWKQASVANTPEAYQLFLQQHPHAAEVTQAQARLQQLTEQRDWQIASATDTRDGYQQFVAKHPGSKWVQEARIRIENFAQAGVSGGAALAAAPTTGSPGAASSSPGSATAASAAGSKAAPATVAAASGAPAPAATTPAAPHASVTHAAARTATTPAAGRSAGARHTHAATLARSHGSARPSSRLVQLGAFRSKARAESEWRQLETRFHTLKSLTPRYVAGRSRGERVYRLQVRLSSSQAASGLCATLRRHARPCVRVNA